VASLGVSALATYYHQYPVYANYSVNQGANPGAPTLNGTFCGENTTVELTQSTEQIWFDAGSNISVSSILSGSNSSERWSDPYLKPLTINGSLTISPFYFHQYSANFSYSVIDGGIPSPPSISGLSYGCPVNTSLGNSSSLFWLDAESNYSFTNILTPSNFSERWILTTLTNGSLQQFSNCSLKGPITLTLIFYHQYAIDYSYLIYGGGAPMPPSYYGEAFGNNIIFNCTNSPMSIWLDAGSNITIPVLLLGSNSTERWFTPNLTGFVINCSNEISPIYYNQYKIKFGYSVSDEVTPSIPPIINGSFLGNPIQIPLNQISIESWLDAGSNYSYPSFFGSNVERWVFNGSSPTGIISSPTNLILPYIHQYFVIIQPYLAKGGSISYTGGWVNAGQIINISASASLGWQFESWNGAGNESYSGQLNPVSVFVEAPITETAEFYPTMTLYISNDGKVNCNNGFTNRTMPGGSAYTWDVPINTTISLSAAPSQPFYEFKQWFGDVNSTNPSITIVVTSPTTIHAIFDLNWLYIGTIIAGIAVVAISLLVFWRIRKRAKDKLE
jgi:hypothetical protein